jgi:hypothetical protein
MGLGMHAICRLPDLPTRPRAFAIDLPHEPPHHLDVLGVREEIIRGELREAQPPRRDEAARVADEGGQGARDVEDLLRCGVGDRVDELRPEPLARRIDDDGVGGAHGVEHGQRKTRAHIYPLALARVDRADAELQALDATRRELVERDPGAPPDQPEPSIRTTADTRMSAQDIASPWRPSGSTPPAPEPARRSTRETSFPTDLRGTRARTVGPIRISSRSAGAA